MAEVIIMPKLGFNMSEGKLVEWYKAEGEAVAKGGFIPLHQFSFTHIKAQLGHDNYFRHSSLPF